MTQLIEFTVLFLAVLVLVMISLPDRSRASLEYVDDGKHLILWHNPPLYLRSRKDAYQRSFAKCQMSNCRLTFKPELAEKSKAIIFDGRRVHSVYRPFKRPKDQLWVWWSNEAPSKYREVGPEWSSLPYVSIIEY